MKPLALLLLCAACAAPGFGRVLGPATVYEDVSAPLEYRADVRGGAREVRGAACQTGIFIPTVPLSAAWGDGGYRDAVARAQAQAPRAALTDVRADLHVVSILTILRRQCVVVTAAAVE